MLGRISWRTIANCSRVSILAVGVSSLKKFSSSASETEELSSVKASQARQSFGIGHVPRSRDGSLRAELSEGLYSLRNGWPA